MAAAGSTDRHEIARWLRHFPEAPVTRLEDASHDLQEDRPDAIAAAIGRVLEKVRQS